MEKSKYIKNIQIENFKCFHKLSINDIGRYNIILGDNNVGKTSLLEALQFDENITKTIYNFQSLLFFRKMYEAFETPGLNPFSFYTNKFFPSETIKIKIDFSEASSLDVHYEVLNVDEVSVDERNSFAHFFNTTRVDKQILKVVDKQKTEYRKFDISQNYESYDEFLPFVYSIAYYDSDLVRFYSENFTENRASKIRLIEQFRNSILPNLIDIELNINLSNKTILGFWIEEDNKESLIPLAMFGDGTIRLFRLVMEIIMSSNKYICIDEIDTGVHHSRYKEFCRIILSTALNNNVQIFITTHNVEFLKSYKEVLEEDNFRNFQNETKCFSLKKLPNQNIKAYSYNFEEFEFAIEQENELR